MAISTLDLPSRPPDSFIVGTTLTWRAEFRDYSAADGWTHKTHFRGPGKVLNVTAEADGVGFLSKVAAADTKDFAAGEYYWQRFVEKDGERYPIDSGQTTFQASLDTVSEAYDGRSQAEHILAEIDALILRTLPGDRAEYTFGNRTKRHYSRADLLQLRNHYQQLVNAERRRARMANGGTFFQTVKARLNPTR